MDFEDRPDTESMLAAFAESDFTRDEKSWNEAVEQDRPPDENAIPEPDEEGNYTTPVLERLRGAWQEYNSGQLDDAEMQALLDRLLDGLDNMLRVMKQSLEVGQDDPGNPITQAIHNGFYEHREAVLRLQSYFETRDKQAITDGLLAAQAATNRLMDAYAFFQRIRAAVNHADCPHCGHENPRAALKCASCQGALPGLPEHEKPQSRLVAVAAEGAGDQAQIARQQMSTPNFQKVAGAVAMWENQEIDDDALWHTLSDVEKQMSAHREMNQKGKEDSDKLTEEQRKVMFALVDGTDAALEANLDALTEMKQYWDDGDTGHVTRGFEKLGAATQLIIEAFQQSEAVMAATRQAESTQGAQ